MSDKKTNETRETPTITVRDGNTTVIVGLHFTEKGKDTIEDKIKRLIKNDVKAGNF